jgi:hypothetical protein
MNWRLRNRAVAMGLMFLAGLLSRLMPEAGFWFEIAIAVEVGCLSAVAVLFASTNHER